MSLNYSYLLVVREELATRVANPSAGEEGFQLDGLISTRLECFCKPFLKNFKKWRTNPFVLRHTAEWQSDRNVIRNDVASELLVFSNQEPCDAHPDENEDHIERGKATVAQSQPGRAHPHHTG